MNIIHCTNKLLAELNYNVQPIPDGYIEEKPGNWYANIFLHNRKKCIVFVHAKTLYAFVVADLKKKEITEFHDLFLTNLAKSLKINKLNDELTHKLIGEYTKLQLAKTASKSIIASMNDIVQRYLVTFDRNNDPLYTLDTFNYYVNRVPMGALKYQYPYEAFKEYFIDYDKSTINKALNINLN